MHDHVLRDGCPVEFPIPPISDSHGQSDDSLYHHARTPVDDWSGVDHGDCGAVSHSVPAYRLRQPHREGMGDNPVGCSATC
jgi:hypothetical protein